MTPRWQTRAIAVLRSPITRWAFVVIAIALGVVAVASRWDEVLVALRSLSWWVVGIAVLTTILFVLLSMLAWRRLVEDRGTPLSLRDGYTVYGLSQLGKYIPGGVWNVAAAAELGADRDVPRRVSVVASTTAMVVTLVTGLAIGSLTFVFSPDVAEGWWWLSLLIIPLVVCLLPPVLERLIVLALRVLRSEPLERPMTYRGLGVAVGYSLLAWFAMGLQVTLVSSDMGAPLTWSTYLLCTGAAALAWSGGFLFVLAPAGVGVRELILVLALSGVLDRGAAIAVVVVTRIIMILVDAIVAVAAALIARRRRAAEAVAQHPDR